MRHLLRRAAKALVARAAYHTHALELVEEALQRRRDGWPRVLVLAYHRVVADFARAASQDLPSLCISRSTFARHLELLRRDYDVVSLPDAVQAMRGERPERWRHGRRPLAAITFDDGYGDVYEHAFPLLRAQGFPFSVFVVAGYVGTDRRLPHDRLYRLLRELERRPDRARALPAEVARALVAAGIPSAEPGRGAAGGGVAAATVRVSEAVGELQWRHSLGGLLRIEQALIEALEDERLPEGGRLLRWEELREMAAHGVVVGAHTCEHPVLVHEPEVRVARELADGRREIEAALEREVTCFAYPDGRYHEDIVDLVARTGYTIAVTTEDRVGGRGTSPLLVPRKTLWEKSSSGFFGSSRAVLAAQMAHLYHRLGMQRPVLGLGPNDCFEAPAGEPEPEARAAVGASA